MRCRHEDRSSSPRSEALSVDSGLLTLADCWPVNWTGWHAISNGEHLARIHPRLSASRVFKDIDWYILGRPPADIYPEIHSPYHRVDTVIVVVVVERSGRRCCRKQAERRISDPRCGRPPSPIFIAMPDNIHNNIHHITMSTHPPPPASDTTASSSP